MSITLMCGSACVHWAADIDSRQLGTIDIVAATFRAGVIIVVEHSDGRVLSCERGDIAGAWQLPQGGIDEEKPR